MFLGSLLHLMTMVHKIAMEIKKRRRGLGMSQADLAHLSDLDRTYISMIERGVKSPTIPVFARICAALNISMSDFLKGIEL